MSFEGFDDLFQGLADAEVEGELARRGFRSPAEARRNLRDIAEASAGAPVAGLGERLLDAFGRAVDPDLALTHLERQVSAAEDPPSLVARLAAEPALLDALATVLGASPFLAGLLIRDPGLVDELAPERLERTRPPSEFAEGARQAAGAGRERERLTALHRWQQQELVRIGARELTGAGVRDIVRELSWLADAVIQTVVEIAWAEIEADSGPLGFEFAVIGVGKLGGEELNFSSDIDVIYIYSDAAQSERATKLARRVHRHLTDPTGAGVFYRVDLRLRPDGGRGPMASSLESLRSYYGTWGETFERLAMSKARPVAGHPKLGQEFLDLVRPFVYRRYLDHAAIDEIGAIKRRIDQHVESSGELERNVKLGRGGIREIEFFVQALQVLYGGEISDIRVRGTLEALDRLAEARLIERAVGRRLRDAYLFLRSVEHKLQIVHCRQTHTLPEDPAELDRCARRMRMTPAAFRSALESHRRAVHEVFRELFANRAESEEGTASLVHQFVNGAMDDAAALKWLAAAGFEDPRQAHSVLGSLRDAPAFGHSPARMKNLLANVLAPLLDAAARLIRKEKVLAGFERLTSAMGAREAFFTSLLESPRSIPRLAQVFALSDPLADVLVRRPGTVEFLIDEGRLARPIRPPFETDSREILEFRLGCQHLFGTVSRRRASRLLTRFAAEVLCAGIPAGARIAVFAVGKFGERELGYRSDLDVIVFHEGEYAAADAQTEAMIAAVQPEFKLDLRLRPEGRKGSLVWSLEKTAEYLETRAEIWERMAWTKARFVGGDAGLGARAVPLIDQFVYGKPFGPDAVERMKHIRRRMEAELARETEEARDVKLGRGGLVDLEFLAGFQMIRRGLRIANTSVVLRRTGLVELAEDYAFLREVEAMLRLWNRFSTSRIESRDVPALQMMLELRSFESRYAEVTGRVRQAFERFV